MKKFLALILALLMGLSLVACGGSGSSGSSGGSSSSSEGAGSTGSGETSETPEPPEAPEMEDSLIVYSTATEEQLSSWSELFRQQYPEVEIEFVSGSSGELITRVTGEAAAPKGDVFMAGLLDTDGDVHSALFEHYLTPYEDEVMDGYQSNNGFYSYNALSTVCLCVNTDLEAELGLEIESYADLLDPKLKGKVLMADPNSSSSAWNNVCNLMSVFGLDSEEAWDYIGKLMENVVIAPSSSATFNSIVQGEYVVGLTYENGAATPLSNGADNIELVYPTEGVSAAASGVAVIKNCPHPVAAKAFVDTLMSAEAQTIASRVDTGTRFTNINMTLSENCVLAPTDSITWVDRPVEELSAQKAAILEKWNTMWAAING